MIIQTGDVKKEITSKITFEDLQNISNMAMTSLQESDMIIEGNIYEINDVMDVLADEMNTIPIKEADEIKVNVPTIGTIRIREASNLIYQMMGRVTKVISSNNIKFLIFSNEEEFRTDVFKIVVSISDTFAFNDVSVLQKTVDNLEFKEDTEYTIFGLTFTAKRLVY